MCELTLLYLGRMHEHGKRPKTWEDKELYPILFVARHCPQRLPNEESSTSALLLRPRGDVDGKGEELLRLVVLLLCCMILWGRQEVKVMGQRWRH